MKRLSMAALCLVSMLVTGMALAGNAAAALLWLVCLENASGTLTKYSSNQCTEAASTGKWQSLGLPSGVSDTVRLLAFSLRLADSATGVEVECPDPGTTGWGLIESTNKGVIKVASVENAKENCKVVKGALGCETATLTEVKGADLPWKTEIFETAGKNLTLIKEDGGGKPGWTVVCNGLEDKCVEGAEGPESVELVNGVTKGILLVLGRFEKKVKAKCSLLGGETGTVSGLVAILLWNGQGLSVTSL